MSSDEVLPSSNSQLSASSSTSSGGDEAKGLRGPNDPITVLTSCPSVLSAPDQLEPAADGDGLAPKTTCLTVYGSSGSNLPKEFVEAAFELGKEIAKNGMILLNGGGGGLMQAMSDGAYSCQDARVHLVTLKGLTQPRPLHNIVEKISWATTMPERKRMLYESGDAYVALPGGLGTLEEIAEVMSWRQLNWHRKPIVLLNTLGFWNGLVAQCKHMIETKCVAPSFMDAVAVVDTPQEVIKFVKEYKPFEILRGSVTQVQHGE